MKFKVKTSDFLKEIKTCRAVMGSNAISPILTNILVEAKETGEILLVSTDLEIFYQGKINADVEEIGIIAIPCNNLLDIISTFSAIEILQIEVNEGTFYIKTDKAEYKLFANSAEDYPSLPDKKEDTKSINFSSDFLQKIISKTSYAISTDESKPELNGILLNSDGKLLTVAATDGRRLGVVEIEFDKFEIFEDVIVPAKVLKEVAKLNSEDVRINISDKDITFQSENTKFISRLIEGKYPAYKNVIPDNKMVRIEIDKNELLRNLKGVMPIAKEISFTVKFIFEKEELTISALSSKVGRGVRKMNIKNEISPFSISYNSKYLVDCLNTINGDIVVFEPVSIVKATKILPLEQDEKLTHTNIIMPVRTA